VRDAERAERQRGTAGRPARAKHGGLVPHVHRFLTSESRSERLFA
jgi:hypothetical protein